MATTGSLYYDVQRGYMVVAAIGIRLRYDQYSRFTFVQMVKKLSLKCSRAFAAKLSLSIDTQNSLVAN